MIVSGSGVGKSFGVETVPEDYDMLTEVAGKSARTEVVKGPLHQLVFPNTLQQHKQVTS